MLENLNVNELTNSNLSQLNRTLNLKPGQKFYYEAMIFLMNKQTKIIEHQKLEILQFRRIPTINPHSKELVEKKDPNRVPIFARSLFKPGLLLSHPTIKPAFERQ